MAEQTGRTLLVTVLVNFLMFVVSFGKQSKSEYISRTFSATCTCVSSVFELASRMDWELGGGAENVCLLLGLSNPSLGGSVILAGRRACGIVFFDLCVANVMYNASERNASVDILALRIDLKAPIK